MGTKRLLRGVCPFKCALVSLRRSPYVTNGLLPDLEPGREVVERLTRRRVRPRLGGGVACAGGDPAELQQQRAAVSAQAAGYPAASSRPSASSASRSRRRHRLRLIVEPALLSHVNRYFELASTSTSSVQVAAPVSGGGVACPDLRPRGVWDGCLCQTNIAAKAQALLVSPSNGHETTCRASV